MTHPLTDERPPHEQQEQPETFLKRQRRKNLAVLAVLVGLIALIYLMTIVKLQQGA